MMIKGHPCTQDCPRRTGTCQATCPDLAAFNAEQNAKNEARDAERQRENMIGEYVSDAIKAWKWRRKRKR